MKTARNPGPFLSRNTAEPALPGRRCCPRQGEGEATRSARSLGASRYQSAWRRRKAGISKSSMPPEDSASTFAAAIVRLVRHTLGTAMPS